MSTSQGHHYHVAIFLNHDAFAFMGRYDTSHDNMYTRIRSAWDSALGAGTRCRSGAIHIPENAVYKIVQGDHGSFNAAFCRLSYLAKLDTKTPHNAYHVFGASHNLFLPLSKPATPDAWLAAQPLNAI